MGESLSFGVKFQLSEFACPNSTLFYLPQAVQQLGPAIGTLSGIALTTRQVARGESDINLANKFLIKFAKQDFLAIQSDN